MTEQNGERALITSRQTSRDALAKLERVAIEGDLSTLSDGERVAYYARVTESIGLNPLTRPFEYIKLNGKLTLYARKDATDQLRQVKGISIDRVVREIVGDMLMTTVDGHDRSGRTDTAMSMVPIKGLSGEALANAYMKGETKAKRRFTLSIGGLGWLDESELDTVGVEPISVDPVTGAIETTEGNARAAAVRSRIRERTAAMRGERIEQGESEAVSDDGAVPGRQPDDTPGGSPAEAPVYEGEVLDVDDIPFDALAGRKGDPWMRRIHAVAAERGMDHDALSQWAAEHFGVDSMTMLDTSERAEMLDQIEALPVVADDASQTGRDGSSDRPAPLQSVPAESSPAQPAPASITDPDMLRTFAAAVLGIDAGDVWGLGDLKPADWEQVWTALDVADHDAYTAWYNAQKRPLRQALMAARQSPRKRADGLQVIEAEQSIERVKAGAR